MLQSFQLVAAVWVMVTVVMTMMIAKMVMVVLIIGIVVTMLVILMLVGNVYLASCTVSSASSLTLSLAQVCVLSALIWAFCVAPASTCATEKVA